MELDLHTVDRTVYTYFDMLGDVGGIAAFFWEYGGYIVALTAGNGLSYELLRATFKQENFEPVKGKGIDGRLEQFNGRQPVGDAWHIPYCNDCRCLFVSRTRRRRIERGERRYESELDIGKFIARQRRQFIAFKVLFTRMERFLLANSKFFVLDNS